MENSTAVRWLACWLVLLITPLCLVVCDISLFPLLDLSSGFAKLNFFLTMTGTRPWGVATTLLVLALVLPQIPANKRVTIFLAMLLALVLNLALSHGLKWLFAEPRPYIEFLAQHHLLDINSFYHTDSNGRSAILAGLSMSQVPIPISTEVWSQWRFETGYSFPSGHTLFSCTLALSCAYALLPQQHFGFSLIAICWAAWVSLSRILLGMHWPIDVLVSALLAGVLTLISFNGVKLIATRVAPKATA